METKKIVNFIDKQLKVKDIPDLSLNGLQVAGSSQVFKIGFAVDPSLDAISKAKEAKCQMLIVHHGLFWGEPVPITNALHKRVKMLIDSNINLYAVHLPLDIDERFGNNIEIFKKLGLINLERFGGSEGLMLGFKGFLDKEIRLSDFLETAEQKIGRIINKACFGPTNIKKIGVISGKGTLSKKFLVELKESDIDLFLTGEFSYSDFVYAKDLGINIIALGHYKTETFGLIGLMGFLKENFDLECEFLELGYEM